MSKNLTWLVGCCRHYAHDAGIEISSIPTSPWHFRRSAGTSIILWTKLKPQNSKLLLENLELNTCITGSTTMSWSYLSLVHEWSQEAKLNKLRTKWSSLLALSTLCFHESRPPYFISTVSALTTPLTQCFTISVQFSLIGWSQNLKNARLKMFESTCMYFVHVLWLFVVSLCVSPQGAG